MQSEPSLYVRLFEFVEALLPYWISILMSGAGPIVARGAVRYRDRFPGLLGWLASPDARPWIVVGIFAAGFGYASFSAFNDVSTRLRKANADLIDARSKGSIEQQRQIDSLENKLSETLRQLASIRNPPRKPDILYKDGSDVATVLGPPHDPVNQTIRFHAIIAAPDFELNGNLEYGDWRISCSQNGEKDEVFPFGILYQIALMDIACRILGTR